MIQPPAAALVAIDVGNTMIHLGAFAALDGPLVIPQTKHLLDPRDASQWPSMLAPLRASVCDCSDWRMTSVNSQHAERVKAFVAEHFPQARLTRLTHEHVPLEVEVDAPQLVGIDRLMAAVAAGALRLPNSVAIVICAGTAITVNLVAKSGAFQGGAILPGMAMASQILDRYTDKLPLIDTAFLDNPPVIGKNTEAALASGIYWGTIGALRTIIEKLAQATSSQPHIFLTGGDAPRLATQLPAARHVPDMVLSGIALTVRSLREASPLAGGA